MDLSNDLLELFESDSDGLFDPPKKSIAATPDDRLSESFKRIIEFVEQNDRMPEIESTDISEAMIAKRLEAIRGNPDKVAALKPIDSLGLLDMPKLPQSIDELFAKDEFGLFDTSAEILDLKHVPAYDKKSSPESVAKRIATNDFQVFKKGFEEKQTGLASGTYKLVRFTNVQQIAKGGYYVTAGMMTYVDDIGKAKVVHGRKKERLRAVFENGTESNMYLRSLASQLYENGYIVVAADYVDQSRMLADDDIIKGYIYILKSNSQDPKITTVKDLYKIGFSTTPVIERTKNAERDPTYLMASVETVASYILTGDYNPQKVEHFLHRIFAETALDVSIIDATGREYKPKEWYSVPLAVIEQAVNLLQSGDIVDYHYDHTNQKIRLNDEQELEAENG